MPQLSAVCKEIYHHFKGNPLQFRQRLIVAASESNLLLDCDPSHGTIVTSTDVRRPSNRKRTRKGLWTTGIAFSPYDGDYYVCQYKVRAPLQGWLTLDDLVLF